MNDILVSCAMVTLPVANRLTSFKSAIDGYLRQTHATRELLILVNRGDANVRESMADHVAGLGREDVRFIELPDDDCLGDLRNRGMELAKGDAVCQWDDDDLHHPERIERQLLAFDDPDCEATLLQDVMQYFPGDRSLYWTSWSATEASGHPGTLMVRASAPMRYPATSLGEDLQVALVLKARGTLRLVAGEPHLFVYVSHGANSWDAAHHKMLAERLAISRAMLTRREASIRLGLWSFAMEGQGISVCGSNGPAFCL